MKKKISMSLAFAIVFSLLLAAVAVGAVLSPTSDIFGLLYGKEKQEQLQKGDIAPLEEKHISGALEVTLEDVVYQAEGDMQGLYGTGLISAREGSNLLLLPQDYSPGDPAGLRQGLNESVPQEAPTYLELAKAQGAQLMRVGIRVSRLSKDGNELLYDTGYFHLPQPDGGVRFTFEMTGPDITRATEYQLTLTLLASEVDEEGQTHGDAQRSSWTVRVMPQLSQAAKTSIAAQPPTPEPTAVPTAAPGILNLVGPHGNLHERYMVAYPEREASSIWLDYGEWFNYIKNPENPWDVGFFSLDEGTLEELLKKGIIEDLSSSRVIMAQFSHLYPRVQQALTLEGKVYALPHTVFPGQNPLVATSAEKWQQLGWRFNKAPATFAQVCALAEAYMDLPLTMRQGTRFLGDGDTAAASRALLLQELVNLAYAEAMAQTGAGTVDTPAFRKGLVQLQSAYQALREKQAPADADGRKYSLFFDGGQSYLDAPGSKQLYLSLGKTPAFPQRLTVAVMNARAQNKQDVMRFMEWLSANVHAQFLPELNAVLTAEQIGRIMIEQEIAGYQEKSYVEAFGAEDAKGRIQELQALLDSDNHEQYAPDENALARFRAEVAPHMFILTKPYPVTYNLQADYLSGKLDGEAFIQALQAALQ